MIRHGGWAIGLMMAILVLVSLASTYWLPETKQRPLATTNEAA